MSKTNYCHQCGQQKPQKGGTFKTFIGVKCFICEGCKPPSKAGRPKVSQERKKRPFTVCLTDDQKKRLDVMGGSKHLQAYLDSVAPSTIVLMGEIGDDSNVVRHP